MTGNDTGRFVWFELMTTDPKAAIASLFTRAGVSFTLGPDGVPRMTPAAAGPAQR